MSAKPLLASFIKFGGLSGIGWLGDACILLLLVGLFGIPPSIANFISSSVAALSVFLLSRELIFMKASGRTALRVVAYLAYVFAAIYVASIALQFIATWLRTFLTSHDIILSATVIAGMAKVAVTPPQLALNFLVSRYMSERQVGDRHGFR